MGVKLTAEQKADIINQYKSGDKEGALATAKSINSGTTTPTTPTPTKTTTTPTQTTPTNQTTPTTYTNKSEYGGQGGIANQKTVPQDNPYVNQGNGQYNYDNKSGYYVSNQPTSSTTSTSDAGARVREEWNKLTYDEQQAKLKENPNLLKGLQKYGAVPKSEGTTETTKQEETPKGDGWDYQDNSPERMMQMSDNVKGFYQTDPRIFQNEDTFRKFFIDGKGRTAEQEQFLMDLYKNMKVYDKYDGMTADNVGNLLARGELPQSYVDYVKNTNPDRYAAIMDAKNKAEDKIKSDAFIDTIKGLEGGADYTSQTSKVIEWLKGQGLLVDKDGNLIDDRTENYANDEELGYQKQIADLNARNLEIDMTMKNTYDDYKEKYPGATKAELMAMAQDTNNDLLREKEDNLVQLTRLQGYVGYMQSERQERNRIGEKAINQLQKQYGMYYDYTPEGMSQLAQAKYAATNVTLDQADNGTDTQKQMALQRVLDDYYAKYGDIIQRSEAQVINDVMAYAKNNGVRLSQALEDNFLKYLRQKPGFKTLSSGGLTPTVSFEKVGDTGYIFTVNPDGTYSLENVNGTGTSTNGYSFTNYTPISSNQLESGLNNFMSSHPLNSTGGECGSFVNDYLQSLGYDRLYTDPIDKKAAITNTDEPAVGSIAVMDSKKYPQYGHTAIVTAINGDKVKLLEANWGDDKKVHERWVNKSEITHGYFNPSLSTPNGNTTSTNNGYDPLLKDFFQKDPTKLTKDQWAKLKNMGYDERTYLSMRDNYLKNLSKEPDASTVKILDTLGYLMTNYPGREQLMASIGTKFLPGDYGAKMGDYLSYVDYIKQNLTMDNLVKLKQGGATFGSLTEGEWPRIEASATRLSNSMSKDKYLGELLDIYNTYAKNAGMGELTLDDIDRMYGSSSSSTQTIKPMKQMESSDVQINNGDIDYDAVWASI